MNKVIFLFLVLFSLQAIANDSTKYNPLSISGYAEVYYSYDFGNPSNHERPFFFYNYKRSNEVNLNLAYIKLAYNTGKVRSNLALMEGTYAQYNLAEEQGLLKNVFEANIGVRLSKVHNLWIDAGVMSSHIGFESAIGKDCWTLSRSLLAENSPYYETGVKLGYTSENKKLYAAIMYLNGWQRIQKLPGNQTPAFGSQLTYKPSSAVTLNWSTFVGNEQPDTAQKWRYFNNFYAEMNLTDKFGLIAGFDIGMQQKKTGSKAYDIWYSPVLMSRYIISEKFRTAARFEFYSDKNGVIILTNTPNGFQTTGFSVNVDYFIVNNFVFRIEGRALNSKGKIFTLSDKPSTHNYFVTTSLAVSF